MPQTPADSNIAISDVATNNASTSKHGFLKKLSNVATEYMDGSGNWSTPAGTGAVASDTLWDAKGDLAAGTGADTAQKLAVGANNKVLTAASGQTTGLSWEFPPGYEFDYVEATSGGGPHTATSEATATTVVTANAVAYDGATTIMVEFYADGIRPDNAAAGRQLTIVLYDDTGGGAASIGKIGFFATPAAGGDNKPCLVRRRLTPSAATHTYSIRVFVNAGTGVVGAGAGGSGNEMPTYIRQTKA